MSIEIVTSSRSLSEWPQPKKDDLRRQQRAGTASIEKLPDGRLMIIKQIGKGTQPGSRTESGPSMGRRQFFRLLGLYATAATAAFSGGRAFGLWLEGIQNEPSSKSAIETQPFQPRPALEESNQLSTPTVQKEDPVEKAVKKRVPTAEEQKKRLDRYEIYDLEQNFEAVEKIRQGEVEGLLQLYSNSIEAAAAKYHLDPNLHRALIFFESGFHPSIVSSSYATGLGQIMHLHGKNLDYTDPQTNILKSAEILREYHGQRKDFGDASMIQIIEEWGKTLKDYNGGPYRESTSEDTEKYAQNIITLFSNFNKKQLLEFVKEGHGVWAIFYWNLMPTNPLVGETKRVGVDFGQEEGHQSKNHQGWDFASSEGEPVYPTAPGKIAFAGWLGGQPESNQGLGLSVVLQHDTSFLNKIWPMKPVYSIYSHMSEFGNGIELGKLVSPENPIGYVGSTGNVQEPQLHYAVYFKGGVNHDARRLVGGEWKHPLWLLPPKQGYPGEEKINF